MFIGIALEHATRWDGIGFVNYRATQRHGHEVIYGHEFSSGDKIGVLLNMDHGTISFFKDFNDFQNDQFSVVNMGIAYHSLRSEELNNQSILSVFQTTPTFFPCVGMKNKDDQLSIRNIRWASSSGLEPMNILENLLNSRILIRNWRMLDKLSNSEFESYCKVIYVAYLNWRNQELVTIETQPGIDTAIDTRFSRIHETVSKLLVSAGLQAINLSRDCNITTPYGNGKIIGIRSGEIWYTLHSGEHGSWYWTNEQFVLLLIAGACNQVGVVVNSCNNPLLEEIVDTSNEIIRTLTFDEFSSHINNKLTGHWTLRDDEALVKLVNTFVDKFNEDPLRLNITHLDRLRRSLGTLTSKNFDEIQVHYCVMFVFNRAVRTSLPFFDIGKQSGCLLTTFFDQELANLQHNFFSSTLFTSLSGVEISSIKKFIFTRTKLDLWKAAIMQTNEPIPIPADEYDKPSIPEIKINRIIAKNTSTKKESLPLQEKINVSVLGQLMRQIDSWDGEFLRKSISHGLDQGQSRNFYVKFDGEGVDDQGGPFRAIFQMAVEDEAKDFLNILVPCSNAQSSQNTYNKDLVVMNHEYCTNALHFNLFEQLGKVVGLACRHQILLSLSFPHFIWKALTGEMIDARDLMAIEKDYASNLKRIDAFEENDMSLFQIVELLSQKGVPEKILNQFSEKDVDENCRRRISKICNLLTHMALSGSHRISLLKFYQGLSHVIPTELFSLFNPQELEILICGEPDVDIEMLKKATEYINVSPNDR